jgi:MYXO-CTERM domain-containing protein
MRPHALSGLLLCTGLWAFATGCTTGAQDAENVLEERNGAQASPIIEGTTDGPEHDSVLLLALYKGGGFYGVCTGTLVAPNLVLTARHCVTDSERSALCRSDGTPYQGGKLNADFAASDIYAYTGTSAAASATNKAAAAARGKALVVEKAKTTYCDGDVAFILLDKPVNAPVAPMRLREGAREGETITAVGWGLTETGRTPQKRLKRGGVRVEAVGPLVLDSQTRIGLAASEFLVGESFCSGDSGGPAFASTGAVVGVVSRGGGGEKNESNPASTCIGQYVANTYTHVATKQQLVNEAFRASGYSPRDEGTPPGLSAGASCKENVDCSSNVCNSGKCFTRCTDATACGAEEECKPQKTGSDIQICVAKPKARGDAVAPPEAPAPPPAPKTTTTTTTGCSASPAAPSAPSHAFAGLLVVAAVVASRVASRVRRRR